MLVAQHEGYFEQLCLDVEVRPSFSTDNYPFIASNDAQFASAGSFSEMVDFAGANDAGFVALGVEGRTGIDALLTKKGEVSSLADLEGTTIGVKGALTTSVRAMLADFIPKESLQIDEVKGIPEAMQDAVQFKFISAPLDEKQVSELIQIGAMK